jgi:hypothetical protein
MAFLAGYNSRIWFDGLASTGYLENIDVDGNVHAIDVSTLLHTAKTFIPGLEDCKIKMKGFYDTNTIDPTSTFEGWLFSRKRAVYPVTYLPAGGNTLGDPAYILYGLMTSYTIDSIVKDAVSVKTEFQTSRGLLTAKVLVPDIAETASNAGTTSLDNAASSANGGSAALQVSAVSGSASPSLAVKLQHSTDNSIWADVTGGAFSTVTAVDGQFIEFTGTVNRYLRVVTTVTGTTPQFTYNVTVHRN